MSETASALELLGSADLEVVGRVMPASNQTFLCTLGAGGPHAVYKPVSGERPLWDFTTGTLAQREYAAWLVSETTGWSVVPPTVLRDGPLGEGMVQLWMEHDVDADPVDLVPAGHVPPGYRRVLDAYDAHDRPVTLVHEDSAPLRRMAVLDLLLNNTDRKGGHVLPMSDGHRHGVDHGVCFHVDDKLRTVLWGWAGEPLGPEEVAVVEAVGDAVDGDLGAELAPLLTPAEIAALRRRIHRLLARPVFPVPAGEWPSIPWPPF